jgi:hypothetical protein
MFSNEPHAPRPHRGLPLPDAAPFSPSELDVMRVEARRYFAPALQEMAAKVRTCAIHMEITVSMCSEDSCRGVSRGALQGHAWFCRDQFSQGTVKESLINALASNLEDEAHKWNIYPGVMRDLFSGVGWTR